MKRKEFERLWVELKSPTMEILLKKSGASILAQLYRIKYLPNIKQDYLYLYYELKGKNAIETGSVALDDVLDISGVLMKSEMIIKKKECKK